MAHNWYLSHSFLWEEGLHTTMKSNNMKVKMMEIWMLGLKGGLEPMVMEGWKQLSNLLQQIIHLGNLMKEKSCGK